MNVLSVIGTANEGNTKALKDLFMKEFSSSCNIQEVVLPKDFSKVCLGCANCILKGENYCPHHQEVYPILKKILNSDILVFSSPVIVMSVSSAMKMFLDHLAYMWMAHRPEEKMFSKVGLVIYTAGGAGMKDTVKLLKNNMENWGVKKVFSFGITTMKMKGNYSDYKRKDKVEKKVKKLALKVKKHTGKKTGLKMRILFNIFRLNQLNSWNKMDHDHWEERGWLNKERPYKHKEKKR